MKATISIILAITALASQTASANSFGGNLFIWVASIEKDPFSGDVVYGGAKGTAMPGLLSYGIGYESVRVAVTRMVRPCWTQETQFHPYSENSSWNTSSVAQALVQTTGFTNVQEGGFLGIAGHSHTQTMCPGVTGSYCAYAKAAVGEAPTHTWTRLSGEAVDSHVWSSTVY